MKAIRYRTYDILGSKGVYMIFFFGSYIDTYKTLKDAKQFIDEILS